MTDRAADKTVGPWWLWLTAIVVLAAALRLVGAMNDLWLDELISIQLVGKLNAVTEVFTRFNSDNNHYLNSIYLYFLGQSQSPLAYRALSIFFGIASIPLAYWALIGHSQRTRLLFAFFIAVNYPLIHFSSEARGYGTAVFAALLAFGIATRWLSRPSWPFALAYTAACMLGVLGHLTFLFVYAVIAIWTLVVSLCRAPSSKTAAHYLLLQLPAMGGFALLYWVAIRGIVPFGGPPPDYAQVISRILALGLGWPGVAQWSTWLIGIAAIGLLAWLLVPTVRSADMQWLFFLLILLVPIVCWIFRPRFLFARYFLVLVPFLCLALAIALERLWHNKQAHLAYVAAVAVITLGQLYNTYDFFTVGRGDISDASRFMADHTPGSRIVAVTDQPFRLAFELEYGRRFLPRGKLFDSPDESGLPAPDWLIRHGEGFDPPGDPIWIDPGGGEWARVAYFPCSELSGQAWTIYHRGELPTSANKEKQ